MTDKTDEFAPTSDGPEMTPEEIAATSPPVEEPLVLDDPVGDAGGEGGSDPASTPPVEAEKNEAAPEGDKTGQTVPLATLMDERKALQTRLDEQRDANERRIAAILERLSPAPVEEKGEASDPMPDPITEPESFERWLTDRDAKNERAREAERAELMDRQNFAMASQQEAAFKAANPHYEAAFSHLQQARAQEILLTRPDIPQDQIVDTVNNELLGLAKSAAGNGRNAAEVIYQLSQARGWAEPVEEPKEAEPETSTVDQVNKAAAASSSVGAASGGGSSRLTAAAIANMSVDEIAALDQGAFKGAMS